MPTSPTLQLREEGQSLWLDYIRRRLLTGGELQRLIDEDALRGLTSNPAIFEQAIAGSDDYDDQIAALLESDPTLSAEQLYERIAIDDIQRAADLLRPVYEASRSGDARSSETRSSDARSSESRSSETRSGGSVTDGVVSLEVSPHLARDTAGTVAEARRLWAAVDRPNLMIKVPATEAGIPAIEQLLSEGINVNVTLMFSMEHYEQVAAAYLRGLEAAEDPTGLLSVASFFVSRVAREVDTRLEAKGLAGEVDFDGSDVAVANAKMAYRRFQQIFHEGAEVRGQSFEGLKAAGAEVQRPLWASTSTKDPSRSDVLYVETLIGDETVNTVPPATLDAFRDHGEVRGQTVADGLAEAEAVLERLAEAGIDLADVTETLQERGVEKFARPFEALMETLEDKRSEILGEAPVQ